MQQIYIGYPSEIAAAKFSFRAGRPAQSPRQRRAFSGNRLTSSKKEL
jgi:hypothetical protein